MQLEDVAAAGGLVQSVDVLRRQGEAVGEPALEGGEGVVAGVRGDALQAGPAGVVEAPHQGRVAGEAVGRRHVGDGVALPQARRAAERRHAALGRDPRARQDGDAAGAWRSDLGGAVEVVLGQAGSMGWCMAASGGVGCRAAGMRIPASASGWTRTAHARSPTGPGSAGGPRQAPDSLLYAVGAGRYYPASRPDSRTRLPMTHPLPTDP